MWCACGKDVVCVSVLCCGVDVCAIWCVFGVHVVRAYRMYVACVWRVCGVHVCVCGL